MGKEPNQDLVCLRVLKHVVLIIRGPHARALLLGMVVIVLLGSLAFIFWAAVKYKALPALGL